MTQLQCVTDKAKKKTYWQGKQSIANGSDPPRSPLEGHWRDRYRDITKEPLAEVMDSSPGSVGQGSTGLASAGLKVFEKTPAG